MTVAGDPLGYVFGYGSLVAELAPRVIPPDALPRAPFWATLHGYRRCWDVAMDNAAGGQGGKHFIDPATGERPAIQIAWLNVEAVAGAACNGLAVPVDAALLADLDRREASYGRVEIGAALEPSAPLPVWTYIGTERARALYEEAHARGTAVVSRAYSDAVRAAFAGVGADALAAYEASTVPPEAPLRDLHFVRGRAQALHPSAVRPA